jgi:phosphoribosylaminoimidazolecarboxamide formyltransferase/IMP cyclohydrolase
MMISPIKRALLSVSDKTGLLDFARNLSESGVEIISTGGTSHLLNEAGIPHKQVEDITGMPEMLDGRVKTLHPKIHGGILGRRDEHELEASRHEINWIDLVVVNFYPFADAIKDKGIKWDQIVDYIDIGGPTMVRAAAKNFGWVGVVVDPADYEKISLDLRLQGGLDFDSRKKLAEKAFGHTCRYDAMIYNYFLERDAEEHQFPQHLDLQLEKLTELRYGENPHQKAAVYQSGDTRNGILAASQLQGKPVSYNNIVDAEAAWTCVSEFDAPSCVIIKHANPCGVASAQNQNIDTAYKNAFQADPLSAFGGIIALNRPCTGLIAEAISDVFMEVVLAPAFTEEALTLLGNKPNLRVLEIPLQPRVPSWEMKCISGGILIQEKDIQLITEADLKVMTKMAPTPQDIESMLFAWRVLKHIKSNGILIAKDNATVGIGAGQVSRIESVEIAVRKAGDKIQGAVLASDAFFPFRDSIDRIGKTGVRAIIQPGGSVRDEEVIAACDQYGIAMVFTGKRCFRH